MNKITENKISIQWQEKYYQCLALEFSNPNYFKVHHLLVLTYMLQTNSYKKNDKTVAISLLKKCLSNTITPQMLGKSLRKIKVNQSLKNESSLKSNKKLMWNLNIMNVRTEDAIQYCKDVKLWATDVLTIIESDNFEITFE